MSMSRSTITTDGAVARVCGRVNGDAGMWNGNARGGRVNNPGGVDSDNSRSDGARRANACENLKVTDGLAAVKRSVGL